MSKIIDNNIKDLILNDLYEIGLNGKESQVYLSLIGLGEVGASKICADTLLHRQFVYESLYNLEKRGLAHFVLVKGRKKFQAKNPKILASLLEEKKRITDRVINNLHKVAQIPEDQVVEVIRGDESYVTSAFNLLKEASINTEVLVISGFGDKFVSLLNEKMFEYEKIRNKKDIKIKYIGSETQRVSLEKQNRKNFSYKLLPGHFSDITNVVVWPTIITLDTFAAPVTQTIIRNPTVSVGYKEFFETLWQVAK